MTTEVIERPKQNGAPKPLSVIGAMAEKFGMEPPAFEAALRATVVPSSCSPAQFAAFLLVAKKYDLDPVTKQIYAFPSKGGGITPIVGIDGWLHLANSHPAFNGMEFEDHLDGSGKIKAITCRVFRKDRDKPMACTEYMDECRRDTDPWRKSPARMLRHRAAIQAIRYAFSFSGIIDEDEYGRINDEPPVPASKPFKLVDAEPLQLAADEPDEPANPDPSPPPPNEPLAPDTSDADALAARWKSAYPRNKGETHEAWRERFFEFVRRVGECEAKTLEEINLDALEKCNITLDDMERE